MIIINELNGAYPFVAFAVHPNLSSNEINDVVNWLREAKITNPRAGFIDLAPTQSTIDLISKLSELGIEMGQYVDHHLTTSDPRDIVRVRKHFQNDLQVRILRRSETGSCLEALRNFGEFKDRRINIVFFDEDPDGFLSMMYSLEFGHPGIEQDALILDGAGNRDMHLSYVSKWLLQAYCCRPNQYLDKELYDAMSSKIYSQFLKLVSTPYHPDQFPWLHHLAQNVYPGIKEATERVVMETVRNSKDTLIEGYVLSDFRPLLRARQNFDIAHWKQRVFYRFGSTAHNDNQALILALVGFGHLGEQVSVYSAKELKTADIDLRTLLPNGQKGRLKHRIHFPYTHWNEFMRKWRVFYSRWKEGLIHKPKSSWSRAL